MDEEPVLVPVDDVVTQVDVDEIEAEEEEETEEAPPPRKKRRIVAEEEQPPEFDGSALHNKSWKGAKFVLKLSKKDADSTKNFQETITSHGGQFRPQLRKDATLYVLMSSDLEALRFDPTAYEHAQFLQLSWLEDCITQQKNLSLADYAYDFAKRSEKSGTSSQKGKPKENLKREIEEIKDVIEMMHSEMANLRTDLSTIRNEQHSILVAIRNLSGLVVSYIQGSHSEPSPQPVAVTDTPPPPSQSLLPAVVNEKCAVASFPHGAPFMTFQKSAKNSWSKRISAWRGLVGDLLEKEDISLRSLNAEEREMITTAGLNASDYEVATLSDAQLKIFWLMGRPDCVVPTHENEEGENEQNEKKKKKLQEDVAEWDITPRMKLVAELVVGTLSVKHSDLTTWYKARAANNSDRKTAHQQKKKEIQFLRPIDNLTRGEPTSPYLFDKLKRYILKINARLH